MSDEKAVTVVQPRVVFNPERDTNKAQKAARRLVDIVKQNGWAKKFGGEKEHLFYEAWQTLGKYYDVTVSTKDAEFVRIGEVEGFKAVGYVIDNKTGIEVGHSEAYCMRDEPNWKAKPTFQLASMAQTRAGSKALRQMFGFVVALAGYNPTPAEEMDSVHASNNFSQATDVPILATEKQISFMKVLWKKAGGDEDELEVYVQGKFSIEKNEDMTKNQASEVIEMLTKRLEQPKQPVDSNDDWLDEVSKEIS